MGSNSDGDSPGANPPSSLELVAPSHYCEPSPPGGYDTGLSKGGEDNSYSSPSRKHKKKTKKKKKKEEESDLTASGPTSTSSTPEYVR